MSARIHDPSLSNASIIVRQTSHSRRGGCAAHVWARVARLCTWVRDGVGIGDWGWGRGRARGEAFERVGDGAGDAAEDESEGLVEEALWVGRGASAIFAGTGEPAGPYEHRSVIFLHFRMQLNH